MTKHQSLWFADAAKPVPSQAKSFPSRADVVVVGGGISGVTCALLLQEAGKKVVLLDMKDKLCGGDTGHTTGHITALLDTGYAAIIKTFGLDAAKYVARSHTDALLGIERRVAKHKIDCQFTRTPAYLYAAEASQVSEVEKELEALNAVGLGSTQVAKAPLPFSAGPALRLENQAHFQPIVYVEKLAEAFTALGGTICLDTRVKNRTPNKDHVTIETSRGDIIAEEVVFATHTPPNKLSLQTQLMPSMTYAMAFAPKEPITDALFYDTEEPYHYTRTYTQNGKQMVIVGGKDHRTGAKEDTDASYQELEAYIRKHFGVTDIAYRWSGQIFDAVDGLPFYGRNPGADRVSIITGLSGNGMLSGSLGAEVCADIVLGKSAKEAEVYAPSRVKSVLTSIDTLHNAVEVGAHLVGDRVKAFFNKDTVKAGEGGVLKYEGHLAAVYNDDGKIHCMSPVCPHAGCYVKWNKGEKTFDCPCHGSRFSAQGKLLEGPAVSDLSPL